jgi:uncharacterized tellurite resistance protein B-like protein
MRKLLDNFFGDRQDKVPDKVDPKRNLQIATTALLLEIAGVDDEFTDDERNEIIVTLKNRFNITTDEVNNILDATRGELEKRIDLYFFTNQINEHFNNAEKIEIIEMVWRVIYADRHLDGHEDSLVHRLAKLLRLQHSQLIDAKLRVKRS